MRSVLLATDFVRKDDGTLTPLEINTNSGHEITLDFDVPAQENGRKVPEFMKNFSSYFNHIEFDGFLKSNGITTIKLIDKRGGTCTIFESFAIEYNYQYELISVPEGSLTVPEVEDGEDVLIIRISYDTYALIDDIYARDMFEFHNLIKDEEFAAPVTFNVETTDNVDTINSFKPSQTGESPNYLVKPKLPGYPKGVYPKLYRLDNMDDVNLLKSSITENEFLQEYQFNSSSLIDNRVTFVRSMDLIYGSNLDVFNIINYKSINSVSTQNSLLRYDSELDTDKKLTPILAAKWYPKWFEKSRVISYEFDELDEILMPDLTDKLAAELKLNDSVMGIKFTEDIKNKQTGSVSDLQTFTSGSTPISLFRESDLNCVFINITAEDENGTSYSWYDGINNLYLMQKQGTDVAQYSDQPSSHMVVGDKIFVFDFLTNSPKPLTVTDIYFDIKDIKTYTMGLSDEFREFFIKLDDNLYLLQHNSGCDQGCGVFYDCGSTLWGSPLCDRCAKGSVNCPICTPFGGSYACNSDIRLKENINLIGTSVSGINIYEFNYINDSQKYEGVIAQELIDTEFANALVIGEDGNYKVDYSKIDVEFKKIN